MGRRVKAKEATRVTFMTCKIFILLLIKKTHLAGCKCVLTLAHTIRRTPLQKPTADANMVPNGEGKGFNLFFSFMKFCAHASKPNAKCWASSAKHAQCVLNFGNFILTSTIIRNEFIISLLMCFIGYAALDSGCLNFGMYMLQLLVTKIMPTGAAGNTQ